MNIKQLNHVAIRVADVDRSSRFYSDMLGLEPIARPAFTFPGAWFQLGVDQELHIIGERDEDQAIISQPRGNHMALRVDSIRDVETELKQKGLEFFGPRQRPDGAWQIFLADPDGHHVELCELA